MKITEKAAYLKGLCEGLKLNTETSEGKLIGELIALTSEMAAEIDRLDTAHKELHDYVEELDEDLGSVEEDLYDDDDDDAGEDDDEDEDNDDNYFRVKCPSCGETICFDDSVDPASLVCPACGETIKCEIECDGDCDGCTGCDDEDEDEDVEPENNK